MKRRFISCVLVLALALSLFGCAKKPAAQQTLAPTEPASEAKSDTPAAQPEQSGAVWNYSLTTETTSGEFKNDDGVLLATTSCDRPVLSLSCEGAAENETPPEAMQKVCDSFNSGIAGLVSISSVEELAESAQMQYDEMDAEYREYFNGYSEEASVVSSRVEGSLVEVLMENYGYWGGAHGGLNLYGIHFDLETGEFFTLSDLTDDFEGLSRAVSDEVIWQIDANEEHEYYFDDYEDTVRMVENTVFSLGEDNLMMIYNQYDIAPYVMGTLEFDVGYDKLCRYLNERGERLLSPSPEAKALGNYYEANEMWYWFDSLLPLDYDDSHTIQIDGIDFVYNRVDIPGVTTLADLRAKMTTRLSEELTDGRINNAINNVYPLFEEFDGVLYGISVGRGADMYIDSVDYRAELDADGKGGRVIATITWQDYDEQKEEWVLTGEKSDAEFPFVMTENGAVFTDFHAIW